MITVRARARRPALAAVSGALVLGAGVLPGDPGPAGYLAHLSGAVGRPWAAVLLALAAAVAVWDLPVSRWPLAAVVVAAPLLDPTGSSACMAIAAFDAGRRLRRTKTRVVFLLAATVWTMVPIAFGVVASASSAADPALGGALGSAALFAWLPFAVGLWTAARREVLDQARERADRLEREQQAAADRARSRERARIAHDMHDVIAHRVSLMVLHAGALEVNTADPEAAEAAELIRATGVEALEQLRDVLDVLHAPADGAESATSADLDRLVDDSIQAGVPVSLHRNGSLDTLPAHTARTLYRAVREALTNVHKHAGTARTVVELECTSERTVLHVRNAAPSQPVHALPGTGTGLIAIREAVSLLEGTMAAGPTRDGGYELRIALPRLPGPVPEPAGERSRGA